MQKQQTIRLENGRTLILPPWAGGQAGYGNLEIPDIRDVYSNQAYPVGTNMLDAERVFYYAKTSATGITNTDLGVKQGYRQHVGFATLAEPVVVGDKTLVLDVAGTDGIGGGGAIAENELAGGFLVVFPVGMTNSFVCRILTNTKTTGASEMTLTLQDEIPILMAANTSHVECMASMFTGCETNSKSQEPVVGVAHFAVPGDNWFWLQTWGPVWLAPQGEVGDAGHDHQVVFRHDGSLDEHDYSDANVRNQQHAGFTLSHSRTGGQAAPFVLLQITP